MRFVLSQTIIGKGTGGMILLSVGAIFLGLTARVLSGRRRSRPEFLVANREMPVFLTAMSIAASWVGAPALFVAAQKAYEEGITGFLWYAIPNFMCLALFAPLASRLRKFLPNGYTLPQYMRLQHGNGVHMLYTIQFMIVQLCCFAGLILGGSALIAWLTGLNIWIVRILFLAIPLTYGILGGMRASVITDFVQMVFLFVFLSIVIGWAVLKAGGPHMVVAGFHGKAALREGGQLWTALSFGIPTTIGLLAGPIGDQMQWQRSFVVKTARRVTLSFIVGAVAFIFVPVALSVTGFLGANHMIGADYNATVAPRELIGPVVIGNLLPPSASIMLSLMFVSAIYSTLDSILCAVAALVSTDIYPQRADGAPRQLPGDPGVRAARIGMLGTAIIGVTIASIPNTIRISITEGRAGR